MEPRKKEKIREYARDYYRKQGQTHGLEHLERTLKLAEIIAAEESADREIVELGSLLHQIHLPEKSERNTTSNWRISGRNSKNWTERMWVEKNEAGTKR